jgi:hypothetical protein
MNIKSQFLDQQKFQDKHEHAFLFFFKNKKWDQVCVNVSPIPLYPKLKLHIVPNVCISWKDLTWEMKKLAGIGMTQSIPPNLNSSTLVPEKQNNKVTVENKNQIKIKLKRNKK